MFYKVVKDGKIVDVLDDSELCYIHMDVFLKIPVRCGAADNPFGILASDSSVIYALGNTDGYDRITLKEFDDEAEFKRLKDELAAARTPEYVEPDEPEDETVDPSALENSPITAEEALNIILGVYE